MPKLLFHCLIFLCIPLLSFSQEKSIVYFGDVENSFVYEIIPVGKSYVVNSNAGLYAIDSTGEVEWANKYTQYWEYEKQYSSIISLTDSSFLLASAHMELNESNVLKLVEIDTLGQVLETLNFQFPKELEVRDIILDSNKNLYVVGAYDVDGFIMKLDSEYNVLWNYSLSSDKDDSFFIRHIHMFNDSLFYLTGDLEESWFERTGFVAQFDADGQLQWCKSIQNETNNQSQAFDLHFFNDSLYLLFSQGYQFTECVLNSSGESVNQKTESTDVSFGQNLYDYEMRYMYFDTTYRIILGGRDIIFWNRNEGTFEKIGSSHNFKAYSQDQAGKTYIMSDYLFYPVKPENPESYMELCLNIVDSLTIEELDQIQCYGQYSSNTDSIAYDLVSLNVKQDTIAATIIELALYNEPINVQNKPGCINYPNSLVEQQNEISIDIFPNPSSGLVSIRSESATFHSVDIYNSMGQLIKSIQFDNKTSVEFDLSAFQAGMYFMMFQTDKGIQTKILMLQSSN